MSQTSPVFPTHPCPPAAGPGRRLRTFLRWGAVGWVALVAAACSSQPQDDLSSPSLPVMQEAARYRAHARSYYAPPGPEGDPWGPYITEASNRFDVPDIWIRAVMERESGGKLFRRNGEFVTSAPGAMGLMQLMPPTYDLMRSQYGLGDDPFDPHDNILAGTAYIRQMYEIYGTPGFLAAYNAGPGRLDGFLQRGRGLPLETRRYVAAIGRQIMGIYPKNRSQADLMVSNYETAANANAVQSSAETDAVRQAWQGRSGAASYASSGRYGGATSYAASSSPAVDVRSAWAARMAKKSPPSVIRAAWNVNMPQSEQVSPGEVQAAWAKRMPQQGYAAPSSVQAAWASRTGAAASPAGVSPVPVMWGSSARAPASNVRAAWASRPPVQAPAAPVSAVWASRQPAAPPNPGAVQAAWASRGSALGAARPSASDNAASAWGAPPPRAAAPGWEKNRVVMMASDPLAEDTSSNASAVPEGSSAVESVRPAPRRAQKRPVLRVAPPPAHKAAPSRAAPRAASRGVPHAASHPAAAAHAKAAVRASAPSPHGGWSIQIGAFGSKSQASKALGQARSVAPGQAVVSGVQSSHGKLYRARVTGLSHNAAQGACRKLGHCVVISP